MKFRGFAQYISFEKKQVSDKLIKVISYLFPGCPLPIAIGTKGTSAAEGFSYISYIYIFNCQTQNYHE